jgi:hypothetical protein
MTSCARSFRRLVSALSVFAALATPACFDSGETQIPEAGGRELVRRRGSVIVEGCSLDSSQRATLETSGARRMLSEIVLLCLTVDEDGQVSPSDPDKRAALTAEVRALRTMGYRVLLGAGLGSSRDALSSADRGAATLANAATRSTAIATLTTLTAEADGVDLILAPLPSASRQDVRAYVGEASRAFGVARTELFVPPSLSSPSDLPGGEAFDLPALAPLVSRFRAMTLDYSCCPGPGATTDPGWTTDVVRFLATQAGGTSIDFSYPLFGTDFGPKGQRSVTYIEAVGLAAQAGVDVGRSPTGAPTFRYGALDGAHDVYFDDAVSTSLALSALDGSVLSPEVGVVFYGLGAEQPGLFDDLASRTP